MSNEIVDRRRLPLFIHRELNDIPMKAESFRVYAFLVALANQDGSCWPSYSTIGDRCFALDYTNAEVRKRHAVAAVEELINLGLIKVEERWGEDGSQLSNLYIILDIEPAPAWTDDPKPPAPKEKRGIDDEWKLTLCYTLYQHQNFNALMGIHWKQINDLYKLLSKAGASCKDVQTWYKQVWRTTWPGNTGQAPKPGQVSSGVAAHMEQARQAAEAQVEVIATEEVEW